MFTYVQRFLLFLEEEQERSLNTTAAYRNDLTQFTKYVKEQCDDPAHPTIHCWRQVDVEMVQSYLMDLKRRDYASATVARKVACIKSFFHWLESSEDNIPNPTLTLEAPRVKKLAPRPIRPQEIERLLAEPAREHSAQALRDAALLETLYASGMRVTEVVALNLADVDLTVAHIRAGDARKARTMVLTQSAAAALHMYMREGRPALQINPSEEALFLNHRGQRLTRQGLWLIIKRYVKQVGITASVTPHTLRQSFAAHQLNAGMDIHQLQGQLGHASAQTTLAYRKAADELAAEAGDGVWVDGKKIDN
jgi:integrase/recombinase XerD